MKVKLPLSTQNWLSLLGATVALISFFMIVFLFVVSAIFERTNSYLGLVIYIILPDEKLSTKQLDSLETRTMDCMDCHNRPSHNYRFITSEC